MLDAEHIDAAVLYTTVGLLWEAELDDPELSQAYTTAYNRWICEFCSGSPRLVPTAHLSLTDPSRPPPSSAAPWARARGAGYVAPFTHTRQAARPPRPRHPVRHSAGPRRAPGDPPHVRAPLGEGPAHGRLGERQGAAPPGLGAGLRRGPSPVHDAVRLRRVRPLPDAQGPRPRERRRLDRLLARPHRRRLRAHAHRQPGAAEGTAVPLLPGAGLDLVRSRRADHPVARRALRRPIPVGVGLPPPRPHPGYIDDLDRLASAFPSGAARQRFLGDNARTLFGIEV